MVASKEYFCDVNVHEGYVTTPRKAKNFGCRNPHTGYRTVMLKKRGTKLWAPYYLHRIVWETANGTKIPEGFHIHHQDSDKSNNRISNLSCVTQKLNNWYAAKNRDYQAIYEKRKQNGFKQKTLAKGPDGQEIEFDSMRQAAQHFKKNPGIVSQIINGKKYYTHITHNGEEWTFVRHNK